MDKLPKKYLLHPDSYRLNETGYMLYCLEHKPHIYKIPGGFTSRHLILIARHVHFPYFFSPNGSSLAIFSDETAFLLKLNGENFSAWLDNLK